MKLKPTCPLLAVFAVAVLWVTFFPELDAQTLDNRSKLVGYIYDPQLSPCQNILTFERQRKNKQILVFLNRETGDIQELDLSFEEKQDSLFDLFLFEEVSAENLNAYSGQIDWRPVVDAKERQWFAFVNSGSIFLSYIDKHGKLARQTVRLTQESSVEQYPRWSPDGYSLVFVSNRTEEGDLYLFKNMKEVMDSGRLGSNPFIYRLTDNKYEDNHPAWSPNGTHIAYTAMQDESGKRNYGINLLSVSGADQDIPISIRLTKDPDMSETRPTWLPNRADLIAYYASKTGEKNNSINIGISRLFKDKTNTKVVGATRPGGTPSPFLAYDVLTNQNQGPVWVPRSSSNSIIYVKRDLEHFNPVHQAAVDKWLNGEGRFDNAVPLVKTRMNREVKSFATSDGFLVAYASQYGEKGFTLSIKRKDIEWGPVTCSLERAKKTAVLKSLLPGWGQFYKGQKAKGYLFATAGVASLVGSTVFILKNRSKNSDFDDAIAKYDDIHPNTPNYLSQLGDQADKIFEERDSALSARNTFIALGLAFLVIEAFSLIDASMGFPRTVEKPIQRKSGSALTFGVDFKENPSTLLVGARIDF